jgi:hypothetical protein
MGLPFGSLGMLTPGVAPSRISTQRDVPLDISDCETPARDAVLTSHRPIMDNKDRTRSGIEKCSN